MKRLFLLIGLVAVAGTAALAGLSSAANVAVCKLCGRNLILNPGADQGRGTTTDTVVKIPHWTVTGGFTAASYSWSCGDLSGTSPGPSERGRNYFDGGPAITGSTSFATAAQTLPLPGSAGHTATLSGWLGGYSSQADKASITVTFLGASGSSLGALMIGPVSASQRGSTSKLLSRTAATKVPHGTTSAKVVISARRADGSDNDGLADSLSLVLS